MSTGIETAVEVIEAPPQVVIVPGLQSTQFDRPGRRRPLGPHTHVIDQVAPQTGGEGHTRPVHSEGFFPRFVVSGGTVEREDVVRRPSLGFTLGLVRPRPLAPRVTGPQLRRVPRRVRFRPVCKVSISVK